ncbi:MAG: Holliday junction branch migration protein RuvA [Bacteroidales bacterium]|nr:Holliday junction branch migration protein RuvA [Bacteroidales bacterium]
MFEYIVGTLTETNPAEAIIEAAGLGYKIQISVQTFSAIEKNSGQSVKLYLHHHLREDEELFYGFFTKEERTLFTLLIGVSGIGPNTARMMLSALSCDELKEAIIKDDVNKIKSIKGIGIKTAQRLIIELRDKVVKGSGQSDMSVLTTSSNPARTEAATALSILGFPKPAIEKALDTVLKQQSDASLEELIKKSLKLL